MIGILKLVNTMRRLVENKAGWLEALNLRGKVRELQVETAPGGAAWGIKEEAVMRELVNATLEADDD